MKSKLFRNPLFLTLILFVGGIFFIGIQGNFPINDDWIFARQVEAFLKGNWELSALIDPSFVSQGLIGYAWSKIFGYGFVQLRILTLAFTGLLLVTVYKALKVLKVPPTLHFVTLMLVAFNPLVFTSTFTYMTEIYFLTFSTLAILYYLKYFSEDKYISLLLGSLFTGLAILVRQVGIVTFIAYLLVEIYRKRLSVIRLFVALVPVGLSIWVFSLWPRHLEMSVSSSFSGLVSNLIDLDNIPERLYMMLLSIPYLAFFSLPLLYKNKKSSLKDIPMWVKVLALALFVFIADNLFRLDIFPVGSVFYVEGLHAKSNYRSYFNLFDNIIFKDFLGILISLGIVRFLLLFQNRVKLDHLSLFLLLNILGTFFIIMLGNDFYDRYLLPTFVAFLLFLVYYFRDSVDFNLKGQGFLLFLVCFMAIAHQHEYLSHTKLRWKQALALQWDTGYVNSIFVDGTYAKYFAAVKLKDYTGEMSGDPPGEYKCYVSKYTRDTDTNLFKIASWIDQKTKSFVGNPEIYKGKRNNKIPKIKKHLDELLYNEEYFSIGFSAVGKKAYVGSWCDEEE